MRKPKKAATRAKKSPAKSPKGGRSAKASALSKRMTEEDRDDENAPEDDDDTPEERKMDHQLYHLAKEVCT